MNQIYHFDSYSPPVLNEAMLRRERDRRRQQRTIPAAVGGALTLFCLLALAFFLFHVAPRAALILSVYLTLSVMGAGAVALVFMKQRRTLSCS